MGGWGFKSATKIMTDEDKMETCCTLRVGFTVFLLLYHNGVTVPCGPYVMASEIVHSKFHRVNSTL